MSLDFPGFADPVLGAQSSFRAVLDAMSRPGSIHAAGTGLTPPAPLDQATAAVLLTLVDAETRLLAGPETSAAHEWIAFHCGAPLTPKPAEADFALALTLPDLAGLPAGSDDGPEDSTTVILQVASLDHGSAWTLAGPGLKAPISLEVEGLPADFAARWAKNHALFPRGVDIILCAGDRLAALPRSLRITEGSV
jgi:alpha-D-ribose 1-methylphosphonate 5-triphosphate synthase subunit PhnH